MPEREQIQSLIANNQTEDALVLLAKSNSDALLLQAQYNSGKKNFNLGLIDFSEWQRIQARVNYGALEMAGRTPVIVPTANRDNAANIQASVDSLAPVAQPKVFISYNHHDTFAMRSVRAALEDAGIKVFVDVFEMEAGESIQAFIEKALKENTFILSLISKNSLVSGWVNVELTSAIILNKFDKKWIPARLDDAYFDTDFFFETLQSLDEKIEKYRANVQKGLDHKVDIRPFQNELGRLIDAKADFGKTIEVLKERYVVDISEKLFEVGISKIINTIKKS